MIGWRPTCECCYAEEIGLPPAVVLDPFAGSGTTLVVARQHGRHEHAGAGGTDAQDWAGMLWRMYSRFAQKLGWKWTELDKTEGEEAGLKSALARVEGEFSYGYLKNEACVHRLVRQSPFNADHLRQTSFALIEV